jgi:formylglycine-generating enzyme required for sulfatase activity
MRPVRSVTVGPILMARHPLTVAQVRHWLADYEDDYADDDAEAARLEGQLGDLLDVMPFRLPSEAEWE